MMAAEEFMAAWIGIPYKLGGADAVGVDCWELVVAWHRDVLGIRLAFGRPYGDRVQAWEALAKGVEAWLEECPPAEATIVIARSRAGRVLHAGIPWHGRILHASTAGVVLERQESFMRTHGNLQWGRPLP
jgi:cell wall-associated NlpC family hydrolase